MKGFELSNEELVYLRLTHKQMKRHSVSNAYRINAIILLGTGWTLKQTSEALLLDEETLRSYAQKYRDGGVHALLKNNHSGTNANKLSDEQKDELDQHLKENLYQDVRNIIAHVHAKYNVKYSRSGMAALLYSLGFTYKKPKLVPEYLNPQAQSEFLDILNDFVKNKPEKDAVLFYDSTHPTYGTIADYGWIKKGTDALLPSPPSRARVNISGAIEINTLDVITTFPAKVNSDTTIEFLKKVRVKYPYAETIHIILDNAAYHKTSDVKKHADENNINLVFLPSYSPNLNLAERLWGFMRRKVLNGQYYESFVEFKNAIKRFFRGIKNRKDALEKLMVLEFQEFDFVNTA